MSSYLDGDDSDSDAERDRDLAGEKLELSEDQQMEISAMATALKAEGNGHFGKGEYEEALAKYTAAVSTLKESGMPKDALILLNRSATYLALKRYVPALNDANQAIVIDPTNWKGHWRKGVALMSMSKRSFRTKQAIEAFESCYACDTLPENKKAEVQAELRKANARKEQQDAETPPADLSNCAPS
eukprot:CAMPEP_0174978116 /NCGR_PEP_ID=MMETSP0004_2-20121128/13998_1 /TAXON_ID=420556 /ORGANISM="Ochromonas sp., Strain CCMP1393" /LENGTH=185 /DNA_ID=CAMNT_0016229399 /DNA_START=26 /DNA_END=583 /DNA_ORIENTATION=-